MLSLLGCVLFSDLSHAGSLDFKLCYEDKEQPPYYNGSGVMVPSRDQGLYMEILHKVSSELGLKLSPVRRPWKRCLKLLEQDRVDGVMGVSFLAERRKIGLYPQQNGALDLNARLAMKSYSIFVMNNYPFLWNGELSEIRGKLIGVPLGYSIVPKLVRAGVKVSEHANTEQLFDMLKHGRVEAVVTLEQVGDFLLEAKSNRFKNIIKLEPIIEQKAYYLMVGHGFYKNNSKISQDIWRLISVYRPEISANYGIKE
ncbi:substrate-binding periplasmic protein [Kiloniella sp.]|uniref:substrate-binding periplasmic protein n=1 Tax=Kiloniella sp. TaxID=1938587 RepID=UPI003A90F859